MRRLFVILLLVLAHYCVHSYLHTQTVQRNHLSRIKLRTAIPGEVEVSTNNRLLWTQLEQDRRNNGNVDSMLHKIYYRIQIFKTLLTSLSMSVIWRKVQSFNSMLASLSLAVLLILPFKSLAITGNKISGSTYNQNSYSTIDKRESTPRSSPSAPSTFHRRSVALHSNKGNNYGSTELVIQDSKLNSFLFYGFLILFMLKGGQNARTYRDDNLTDSAQSLTDATRNPRKKKPFLLSYLKKILGFESSSYHQLTLVYLLEAAEKSKLLSALNSIDSKESLVNIVEEVCINMLRHKDSLIAGKLKYLHAISGNPRVEDLYHKSALQEQAKFEKKMLPDSVNNISDGSSYVVMQLLLLTNGPVLASKSGQLVNLNNKESLFNYRKKQPLNIDYVVTFVENLPNYLRNIDRRKNGWRGDPSYGYACNVLWSPNDAQEVIRRNELVRTWSDVEFF